MQIFSFLFLFFLSLLKLHSKGTVSCSGCKHIHQELVKFPLTYQYQADVREGMLGSPGGVKGVFAPVHHFFKVLDADVKLPSDPK